MWARLCICEFDRYLYPGRDEGDGMLIQRCRIINLQMEGSSGSPGPKTGMHIDCEILVS
jgi:hypothetical protein